MVAKQGSKTIDVVLQPVDVKDEMKAMKSDLADVRAQVAKLIDLLTEKPAPDKPRRPSPTDAQLREMYIGRAKQMRQGRAAGQLGITREELVAKYGDVDYAPQIHDRQKPKAQLKLEAAVVAAREARRES